MILGLLVLLVAGLLSGALAWILAVQVLRLVRRRSRSAYLSESKKRFTHAVSALFVVIGMYYALIAVDIPNREKTILRHILLVSLCITLAWVLVKVIRVVEAILLEKYPVEVLPVNSRARRYRTLTQVVRRLLTVIVILLAAFFTLTVFAPIRTVGGHLIASAGVASIVLGIAAQGTLGQVFAGLQLAFTDALRVDDVVVLEGEWGRIENVYLTHVIVRSWDERRIVLPTTYFTTKPYQNWTKYETRVLGTIDIKLDFTADIDHIRQKVQELLEENENWDRKYWVLEMTDVSESTVTVRLTASAPNGPQVWWLKVQIREALYKYVRDHHPQWLPRGRSAYQP